MGVANVELPGIEPLPDRVGHLLGRHLHRLERLQTRLQLFLEVTLGPAGLTAIWGVVEEEGDG